jgi:uncharacterized protein YjbI with pentapeptide repeats
MLEALAEWLAEGGRAMANEAHLARLKQGVDTWNRWRRECPAIQPDLCEADLSEANLFKVNFFKTNLARARLSGAELYR